MIPDYPFKPLKPLFALKPAPNKEENAERFRLGRDETDFIPSGTLNATIAKFQPTENHVKLETMLGHLADHRSGKKIEIRVKIPGSDNGDNGDGSVSLAQFGKLPNNNSTSSINYNNSYDTLVSSEMLSHEQAADLDPTNAPLMPKFVAVKKPLSVKSM